MRILHTADLHLTQDHPERLEALKQVLEKGENADYLLITGDLFDRGADLEDMKSEIRPLFDDNSFKTFVIPGNHDHAAFRTGDHLGNDLEVLKDGIQTRDLGDVNLVALPYTNQNFDDLINPLSEETKQDKTNILMIHCTLAGAGSGFGGESKYLPVRKEEIAQLNYDYVFSGHIHSQANKWDIGNTVFTYSGSPVSISKSETGKRKIWSLDTEKDKMKTQTLETHYFFKKYLDVVPGEEEQAVESLSDISDDLGNATYLIELSGFIENDVQDFLEKIRQEALNTGAQNIEIDEHVENMEKIVESKLYKEFIEKLRQKDGEVDIRRAEKQMLKAFSRQQR